MSPVSLAYASLSAPLPGQASFRALLSSLLESGPFCGSSPTKAAVVHHRLGVPGVVS